MLFKLYNIKLNRYATPEEYSLLFLSDLGELLQYYDTREMMDTPEHDWKILYGFKHSNGKIYYLNDTNTNDYRTVTIGFNGYSFYQTIKSKSTFYDVNYGGLRHSVGTYIISEQTNLW